MRVWTGAVIGLAALASAPALDARAADPRAEDRSIIEAGERAWGGSFVTGDVATADRLLAADFLGTDGDGRVYDKAKLLGDLRSGPPITSNATAVGSVRFFGDVAVVQGRDTVVGAAPKRTHRVMAWTDVWVRSGGTWRIVSAHDTRIEDRP